MSEFLKESLAEILWIAGIGIGGKLLLVAVVRRIRRSARTAAGIVRTAGNVVVGAVVLLMTMRLFGIDTTPILASAGVVGFAVGFGAQTLVKDLVSGILIVAEDQFAVGDQVKIGGFDGAVVEMTMRTTVLRDKDGNRVYLPNGSIVSVVNLSRGGKEKAERKG
jgi:small conductance mechanosensitive channel